LSLLFQGFLRSDYLRLHIPTPSGSDGLNCEQISDETFDGAEASLKRFLASPSILHDFSHY